MMEISYFINVLVDLIIYLIIARVLLSWFRPRYSNPVVRFIVDTSQPIMDLAQKITPPVGMLDFSPIVAVISLEIIRYILLSLLGL